MTVGRMFRMMDKTALLICHLQPPLAPPDLEYRGEFCWAMPSSPWTASPAVPSAASFMKPEAITLLRHCARRHPIQSGPVVRRHIPVRHIPGIASHASLGPSECPAMRSGSCSPLAIPSSVEFNCVFGPAGLLRQLR